MNMTDGEIVTAYKQAKNRAAQIGILADLNGCERVEMEQHLVALGCIHSTPPPSFDYLRAAELYAQGKSDLEIAEQLGASKVLVAKWRKKKNLAANYPKTRAPTVQKRAAAGETVGRAASDAPAQTLSLERLAALLGGLATLYPHARVCCGGIPVGAVSISMTEPETVEISLGAGGRP